MLCATKKATLIKRVNSQSVVANEEFASESECTAGAVEQRFQGFVYRLFPFLFPGDFFTLSPIREPVLRLANQTAMRSSGLIWLCLTYTRCTSKYLLKTSWGHFREYLLVHHAHGAKHLITQLYCISIISLTLLLNKANKVKIWQIYRLVMITNKKKFAVINSPKCYLVFVFHRSSVDQKKPF